MAAERRPPAVSALRMVAGASALSGAVQTVRPELVLGLVSTEQDRLARQLFATIGMFMAASGCLLAQSLAPAPDRTVLRWVGVQKLGAAVAVTIGVRRALFRRRALGVALFDLASAALCLAYARDAATGEP
jgi:hypothetical protein